MWAPPAETLAALAMPCTATGTALGAPENPSPSVPHSLMPQVISEPSASTAALSWPPAEIARTPLSPLTATGVGDSALIVPSPSSPYLSSPHAITLPELSRARACSAPAATEATPLSELTATGTFELSSTLSLPSWPNRLLPHALTVPLLSSARLKSVPAETAIAPLRALTATGTLLEVNLAVPSWPLSLFPHAITVPLESRARLWLAPAAIA